MCPRGCPRGQGRPRGLHLWSSKHFFRQKRSSKILFQAISTQGNQKKVFADFPQGFWRFPTKFQRIKNRAVLEPRTGQFSRT